MHIGNSWSAQPDPGPPGPAARFEEVRQRGGRDVPPEQATPTAGTGDRQPTARHPPAARMREELDSVPQRHRHDANRAGRLTEEEPAASVSAPRIPAPWLRLPPDDPGAPRSRAPLRSFASRNPGHRRARAHEGQGHRSRRGGLSQHVSEHGVPKLSVRRAEGSGKGENARGGDPRKPLAYSESMAADTTSRPTLCRAPSAPSRPS